ncbi:hypothetical protein AGLY_008233 [Aphis glycines]|uniref:Uncharacterized protein n=1 Tax=Aphis glycines TaxID=307491 RepID=A0A6G0TLP9_APHGL|nr:hypothetical protein AGLY_008233 [Aphis glycines]
MKYFTKIADIYYDLDLAIFEIPMNITRNIPLTLTFGENFKQNINHKSYYFLSNINIHREIVQLVSVVGATSLIMTDKLKCRVQVQSSDPASQVLYCRVMLFTNVNVATKLNKLTSSVLSYDELCCVNNRCVRILLPNLNFLNLMKKKIKSQSIRIMGSERIYEWSDVDSNSVYSSSDDLKSASTEFNLAAHAHIIYKKAQNINSFKHPLNCKTNTFILHHGKSN